MEWGGWITSLGASLGTALASVPRGVRAGWQWLHPPPASLEEGIDGLRTVRDSIREREAALLRSVDVYRERAGACAARGDARDARLAIKLQLMHDQQLSMAQQTLVAIEAHIMALENAVMNRAVVSALQHGAIALGRPPDEDHVDDLLLTLEERNESTANIMRTLSCPDQDVADDAVEQELQRLCSRHLPEAPIHALTPTAHSTPPPSAQAEASACSPAALLSTG